ncbi:hypothetical protein ACIPVB_09000 [Microbacterium sp. NPDC090007]|uniref:hypothetical protein n=1 Tax=Microbacterium sp. NPDC090007 TaxID=3364204 RepID=UPI003811329B
MADITITRTEKGAYEMPLPAGEPTTVLLEDVAPFSSVVITVHDAEHPVYVSRNEAHPKAGDSDQIPPGGWGNVSVGAYDRRDVTLYVVSEGDAVFSVSRS